MPVIHSIHVAPGSRLPMKPVSSVMAEAGKGLVGDRYHGTRHRHVSVQSLESLREGADLLGQEIPAELTRRNITVAESVVPRKPGSIITIGAVKLEVVRIAAPCRLLDDTIGRGAARALHNRAGSICRILEGGVIEVGDCAEWQNREA
ncbi:MAG: MOSC domain-containing protein [Verrucomicrobiales bacterium]|nr:MOSC domain-containing protein [Verrucomicrobiales bacterium]